MNPPEPGKKLKPISGYFILFDKPKIPKAWLEWASKNKVGIDIDQSSIDEELGDLHRHVTHKKVHFDQVDESSVKQTVDLLRTGLPNEVANKLASNAGVISSELSPSSLIGSHKVSESTQKKIVDNHHHRKHSDLIEKKKVSEVEKIGRAHV